MDFLSKSILAIDLALFVLILLVQLIIYPSFQSIQVERFRGWHESYCKRIGCLVVPLMSLQLVGSIVMLLGQAIALTVIKFLAVLATWLLTLLVMVPLHQQLRLGWNLQQIRKLVRLNWLRTFAWGLILADSLVMVVSYPLFSSQP